MCFTVEREVSSDSTQLEYYERCDVVVKTPTQYSGRAEVGFRPTY
jgi:hypothetical protein